MLKKERKKNKQGGSFQNLPLADQGWAGQPHPSYLFIDFLLSTKNQSLCLVLSHFYNFLYTQETQISIWGYLS